MTSELSSPPVLSGLRQAHLSVEEGRRLLKLERKIEKAAERKAAMAKKKHGHSVQQSASFGCKTSSSHYLQGGRMPEVFPVQPTPIVLPGCQVCPVSVACFNCGELDTSGENIPRRQEQQLQNLNSILWNVTNTVMTVSMTAVSHSLSIPTSKSISSWSCFLMMLFNSSQLLHFSKQTT